MASQPEVKSHLPSAVSSRRLSAQQCQSWLDLTGLAAFDALASHETGLEPDISLGQQATTRACDIRR